LLRWLAALVAGSASAADLACLITKNNTNPFFVKMKEGAEKAAAAAAGLDFQAYAGEKDGDAAPQITAIENCVAAGAKGILITPSNDSVGPALKAARAAGILVIALTPRWLTAKPRTSPSRPTTSKLVF
jgi:fructose transport system substrate-binding protein